MRKKKWLAMLLTIAMTFTLMPSSFLVASASEGDKTVPGWVDYNGGHPKYINKTFEFVVDNIAYKKVDGGVEVSPWYWKWASHGCPQHIDHVFAGSEYSNRKELTIPESITYEGQTYKVVGIGEIAFNEVYGTNIILPEGLEYIADSAFQNTGMQKITIPSTVTKIGDSSFKSDFTEITFAENSKLEEIGHMAFFGYCGTSLELPKSVKKIGGRVFEACKKLESITIPASAEFTATPIFGAKYQQFSYKGEVKFAEGSKYRFVNEILCDEDTAIELREEKEHLVIPEGIKHIGDDFRPYDPMAPEPIIESISLPDSLETIGDYAFRDCTSLKEIIIPENVTFIGNGAFSACTSLERAEIKGKITELNATFNGCTMLSEVKIPETLTKIVNSTFSGCSALEQLDFSNIEEIGFSAFRRAGIKEVIAPKLVTLGELSFANCTQLEKVILAEGLTNIPKAAFFASENLSLVILPQSLSSLGQQVFAKVLKGNVTIIFNGVNPPLFDIKVFRDTPNINFLFPKGSEEAYASEEQIKPFITNDNGDLKNDITFGIDFPEDNHFCPGDTFEIKYTMPEDAKANTTFEENENLKITYSWNEAKNSYDVTVENASGEINTEATATISIDGIVIYEAKKNFTIGHKFGEWTQTKAPDCINAGLEEATCTECGEKTTREIPATNHNPEKTDAKEATCTESGNIEFWYCDACDKYFTDEELTKEIQEKDTIIKAKGHSFSDGKCTVCGTRDPNYNPGDSTNPDDEDPDQNPGDSTKPDDEDQDQKPGDSTKPDDEDPDQKPGDSTKPDSDDQDQTPEDSTKPDKENGNNPQTGDETNIFVWLTLLLSGSAAFYAVRKRLKR